MSGPAGLRNPRATRRTPPNSPSPARRANGWAGRMFSRSMTLPNPSRPEPPNQPNSFWAPCAATVSPRTRRMIKRPSASPDIIFFTMRQGIAATMEWACPKSGNFVIMENADASTIGGWFAGRLPDGWFTGAPEVTLEGDQIVVVGTLSEVDLGSGAADAVKAAAPQGRISRFREYPRRERIWIAREAEA